MLNEDSITELKRSLRGRLIQPGDADYDEARKVYNGDDPQKAAVDRAVRGCRRRNPLA